LRGAEVTVAASDYVSAVADLIRPYVPGRYVALGTDGFGRSDTRAALRAFFEVDAKSIAHAALAALGHPSVARARQVYGIDEAVGPPWQR
jgi:pyruvate dehydrogenase E1 component